MPFIPWQRFIFLWYMAFELRLFVAVSAFLLILTDFWVMPKGEIDLLLYVIYCEFAVFGLINFMLVTKAWIGRSAFHLNPTNLLMCWITVWCAEGGIFILNQTKKKFGCWWVVTAVAIEWACPLVIFQAFHWNNGKTLLIEDGCTTAWHLSMGCGINQMSNFNPFASGDRLCREEEMKPCCASLLAFVD